MKSLKFVTVLIAFLYSTQALAAYQLMYKEEFWNLYHEHLYADNLDITENIHWLEQAIKADFANPLNALSPIRDKVEWAKYRSVFMCHVNLTMVKLYLEWANRYTKHDAFFFNAPWQGLNLESLDTAESIMRTALYYWEAAKTFAATASEKQYRWINLEKLQNWEDEILRMNTGELNYQTIIERHLADIAKVRQDFKNMDASTYWNPSNQ